MLVSKGLQGIMNLIMSLAVKVGSEGGSKLLAQVSEIDALEHVTLGAGM